MSNERSKTANYRRCFITDGQGIDASGGQTLQSLIETATKAFHKPWLRALGKGESAHQLLTYLMTKNSCLCGELAYYEHDKKIPLVDIESNGDTWQATIPPNDATGKPRKFQEHSLYFAVRENHCAIIQSSSLSADRFQEFLAWLIQSKANLATSSIIALENLPAKSALDKLKDHNIKSIKFGENLFTKVKTECVAEDGTRPTKRKKFVQTIETSPRLMDISLVA